jgi:DNA-binding transcriptional MerR regulator
MPSADIPGRSLFKAPEVCEIAKVQPYVLRSWEAEFPDLGVVRPGSSARVYRRRDVERVLQLKHLLFVEGLTLAGARRRLDEEKAEKRGLPLLDDEAEEPPAAARASAARATAADKALRKQLADVRQGLQALLDLLERQALPANTSPKQTRKRAAR